MKRRGAESPDVLLVAYGEGKGAETRTTWSAGQRLDVVGCVCVCVCGGGGFSPRPKVFHIVLFGSLRDARYELWSSFGF